MLNVTSNKQISWLLEELKAAGFLTMLNKLTGDLEEIKSLEVWDTLTTSSEGSLQEKQFQYLGQRLIEPNKQFNLSLMNRYRVIYGDVTDSKSAADFKSEWLVFWKSLSRDRNVARLPGVLKASSRSVASPITGWMQVGNHWKEQQQLISTVEKTPGGKPMRYDPNKCLTLNKEVSKRGIHIGLEGRITDKKDLEGLFVDVNSSGCGNQDAAHLFNSILRPYINEEKREPIPIVSSTKPQEPTGSESWIIWQNSQSGSRQKYFYWYIGAGAWRIVLKLDLESEPTEIT